VVEDITGRRSNTTASHWRRLLPPELVRQLADGDAVLLYGNLPSIRVRLRPWYRNRALRRRANHPQDTLAVTGPDTNATVRPAGGPTNPPSPPPRPSQARPPRSLPLNVSVLDAARQRLRRSPASGGD
jgi:type IV secretory pathway TraG/TraD family ATPase VirD4